MHLGARGFVHAELIDPETGAAVALEDGATRRARADPPAPPGRAAAALPHARPRRRAQRPCACGRTGPRVRCIGRTDDMLIVRGVNVFPSAVREVVSAVRAAGQRPHPGQARDARGQAGAAAAGDASSSRREWPPTRRWRRRSASGCAACWSSRPASSWCRGGACSAASTSRSSSSTNPRRRNAEAPEPGRPPHHDHRRGPPDVDRLLGGRAGHAVRVRAAEPRQRVREPPLLRPGRRPPDHRLHQRGAHSRPGAHADRSRLRPPPRVLALAGDVQPGGGAARRARRSATAASRTAGSWTRSTSPIRSAC